MSFMRWITRLALSNAVAMCACGGHVTTPGHEPPPAASASPSEAGAPQPGFASGTIAVGQLSLGVTFYPRGAVSPVRVIIQPTTPPTPGQGLSNGWQPYGMTLDAYANLFVGDAWGSAIRVFAAAADGPAAPIRSFGGFTSPSALSLDARGN